MQGWREEGREGQVPPHLPKVSLILCKKFRMSWLPPFNHSSRATDTILSHYHRYFPEACWWSFGDETERWKLGTEVVKSWKLGEEGDKA
jgi:hypothetical protein